MHSKKNNNSYDESILAAVDLGSNSFHMIVARVTEDGSLLLIDRLKEMVRLGAGLDNKNRLSEQAQQRALDCLERFGERLKEVKPGNIRIVGTNTLRKAKNSSSFIKKAQLLLGHSIDIISGIEEARLVYLGVSHTIASDDDKKRLVIDIGGGSTETIIGTRFSPILMESLFMGCVSMTRHFFSDGRITEKQLKQADTFARQELERISYPFIKTGWDEAIGTSGSIRSIFNVIQTEGFEESSITRQAMEKIRQRLLASKHTDKIDLNGLSEERRPVFIGGFVVLNAIINALNIHSIQTSDGALREGCLYDLLGRIKHEDVRENTVQRMMERYSIQSDHANNIANTAKAIYKNLAKSWDIKKDNYKNVLRWAALLHEIGLTIAHAGYHKHGAYLAKNSDMPGFSVQDQQFLATLIQTHRNKINLSLFEELPEKYIYPAMKLAIILRLAVILHRSRSEDPLPEIKFKAKSGELKISFPDNWLDNHNLIYADLENEKNLLAKTNFDLRFK
jgi:exopolyphosphatase/guanosine-5'-triphosphate,3'-diphosphate pyrophosphatase